MILPNFLHFDLIQVLAFLCLTFGLLAFGFPLVARVRFSESTWIALAAGIIAVRKLIQWHPAFLVKIKRISVSAEQNHELVKAPKTARDAGGDSY